MIHKICELIYRSIWGFKYVSNVPKDLNSFVMIGAPHTSNWDFITAMALCSLMKKKAHFVIKNEWMRFPLGLFFKSLGGIGIDRNLIKQNEGMSSTDSMAKLFTDHPDFILMISPEGTRKRNPNWKTGFYYIALKAKVPIVLAFVDYEKKMGGLGKVIYPSNFEKDMEEIISFYKNVVGKRPELFALPTKIHAPPIK
jgi:1-acyl-sn-glycerol-3-phosphate acyltransferase